jgi:hypothetical protein
VLHQVGTKFRRAARPAPVRLRPPAPTHGMRSQSEMSDPIYPTRSDATLIDIDRSREQVTGLRINDIDRKSVILVN